VRMPKSRFQFAGRIASDPLPPDAVAGVEELFARLVARAWAADHPELLRAVEEKVEDEFDFDSDGAH